MVLDIWLFELSCVSVTLKQDEAIDILPAIQQQQVRSGQFSEVEDTSEAARNSDLPDAQQPDMISSHTNSVFLQRANDAGAREPVANNGSTPFQPGRLIGNASHGKLLTTANRGQTSEARSITKTLKFGGEASTPFKDLNRARVNSQLKGQSSCEHSSRDFVDLDDPMDLSSRYI